jgi:phosphate-selective porin OprO/OprP
MGKNVLFGAIVSVLSGQVQAGSEIETLIKMLHKNGTVDDAQYGRLMDEINAGSKKIESNEKEPLAQLNKTSDVKLIVDKGGIQVKTSDGEFDSKIGGRVQMDAAWHNEDGSEMGNGTEFRRARIYLQGKMFHDWGYKLQYDFTGSGRGGIRDAFLTYNGFDHIEFKAGNFKDPYMLQEQTSSKYITFTERALVDAFASGRHLGVMASAKYKHWTAAVGLFGKEVNTASKGKDEGWGVAGRATYAPINEKTRVIHLGFAGDYRNTGDTEAVRFKQQPETHISGVNIVDTGTIAGVDNYLHLGAELALVEGPLSAQAEYVWTTVERDTGGDVDFDGWYVQAAYFLTGESRRYKKGKFSGVSPKSVVGRNGFGAWQLAARYSTIDLNDGDIRGGDAENMTIGLNWFPTSTLRFSGNYVKTFNINGGAHDNEEPSLFQVRGQWAF